MRGNGLKGDSERGDVEVRVKYPVDSAAYEKGSGRLP